MTDPKQMMIELYQFYANRYDTTQIIVILIVYRPTNIEQLRQTKHQEVMARKWNFSLSFSVWGDTLLINALNFAHEQGQLYNSQKQALINLLEKEDKYTRFIKYWRPISLINS